MNVPATSFAPLPSSTRIAPINIARDTWTIHSVQQALGQPLHVQLNSMVILGSEPMIVDTGTIANRAQWLDDVFGLVDPTDVRWIFISHDDIDHTGNLDETMTACSNATLVCNWAMVERHTNSFNFPLARCRWVMDGESFDIGDRSIVAVRPPVYDSPTTRGLFDPATGVYWSADAFATPLPDPDAALADLDHEFWEFGMTLFAFGAISPWLAAVDDAKFGAIVDRLWRLDITAIAGCHTPVVEGEYIDKALGHMRALPSVDPPPLPDQSVLDEIIAMTAQSA